MKKYGYVIISLMILCLVGLSKVKKDNEMEESLIKKDIVELIWYQPGEETKDLMLVEDALNAYTSDKIGVTVDIRPIAFSDYSQHMKQIMNSNQAYDLAFTSEGINNYVDAVQNDEFLILNELLQIHGQDMMKEIDDIFWNGIRVNQKIYGVPTQKEAIYMPMWVFREEYINEYNIPYEDVWELEDLEPHLQTIRIHEKGVIPLQLDKTFKLPSHFQEIAPGVGYDYRTRKIEIEKIYESDEMLAQFNQMHQYYKRGYVNSDATQVTSVNDDSKQFITLKSGQPYAQYSWSHQLGYDVVARNAMTDFVVTNQSIRSAITAISSQTKYPEEAMQFLNLLHTDEYVINLLIYGIEGIHYKKIGDTVIQLMPQSQDYIVPNYVQGNLFLSYTIEEEPVNKWEAFEDVNEKAHKSLLLGFDFDPSYVEREVSELERIINVFSRGLNTGTLDPNVYVPKLNEMLTQAGIDKVVTEIERQVNLWLEEQ